MKRSIVPVAALALAVCCTLYAQDVPAGAPSAGAAPAAPVRRPRVAVVFSGGSALGMAHIGVLEKIEAAGIPVDMVLGTSMGSLIAGLYASGYSPARMEGIVRGIDWNDLFMERRDSPGDRYDALKRQRFPLRIGFDARGVHIGEGLIEGQNVLSLFTELTLHDLPVRNFDDLPVPYRAVAANLLDGSRVVFSKGSIAEAMRSSMSIPGVFSPYTVDGRALVDGGIVDNMPVDLARQMGADIVIAIESRNRLARDPEALKSALAVAGQTMNLYIEENMKPNRAAADLLIVPDITGYGTASFAEAGGLVQRGLEAGDLAAPQLRALAARIARDRPLVSPEGQANRKAFREPPLFTALRIEGGTPADRVLATRTFSGLTGRRPSRGEVKAAIDAVYATGGFDLVKLDLEPEGDDPGRAVAVVRLVPDETPANAVLVSGGFSALFSAYSTSESSFMPAVVIRDLTGKDSALFAETAFMNRTRFYAELMQPFGPVFLLPWVRYDSRYDSYTIGEDLGITTLYRTAGVGGWAGITLGKYSDLMAGYSFSQLRISDSASASSSIYANFPVGSVSAVFRSDTRAASAFPERGLCTLVRATVADPAFGGTKSWNALEGNLSVAVPLSKTLTLGIAGYGGTDFAGFMPVPGTLPAELYYSLRQPGMFYGFESRPLRGLGNSVAGVALELRARLGRVSRLLGGDLFGIANLSAGVARDSTDADVDFLPVRWCGSLGAGLRLSRNLGILATGSVVADASTAVDPVRPAFALELGTFGNFLEDRR